VIILNNGSKKQFDEAIYNSKKSTEFVLVLIYLFTLGILFVLVYYKILDSITYYDSMFVLFGVVILVSLAIEIYFRKKYSKNSFPLFKF
jgi:hypothetical protein